MKNRSTTFTTVLLTLGFLALLPVAEAKQPSEDRGNGNSAAENVQALNLSTTGSNNTAHGWFSLFSNTTGSSNTANGWQALLINNTGSNNTACGVNALFNNTTGSNNIGLGFGAGIALITGSNNIEIGNEGAFNEGNTIRIGTQGTQIRTFVAGIRGVTTGV